MPVRRAANDEGTGAGNDGDAVAVRRTGGEDRRAIVNHVDGGCPIPRERSACHATTFRRAPHAGRGDRHHCRRRRLRHSCGGLGVANGNFDFVRCSLPTNAVRIGGAGGCTTNARHDAIRPELRHTRGNVRSARIDTNHEVIGYRPLRGGDRVFRCAANESCTKVPVRLIQEFAGRVGVNTMSMGNDGRFEFEVAAAK